MTAGLETHHGRFHVISIFLPAFPIICVFQGYFNVIRWSFCKRPLMTVKVVAAMLLLSYSDWADFKQFSKSIFSPLRRTSFDAIRTNRKFPLQHLKDFSDSHFVAGMRVSNNTSHTSILVFIAIDAPTNAQI